MQAFDYSLRIYYEDTDAGGVVYHSNYLNFMERARTEWLRSLGYDQHHLAQELGIIFVVRQVQIDYLKPARFNDWLTVRSLVAECGRTSLRFHQQIMRTNQTEPLNEHLIDASVKVVCVNTKTFRPTAVPTPIRELLTREH